MMAVVLVLGCVLGVMAWLGRSRDVVRDAARRSACVNNLKQIALALQNYMSANQGQLPPAVTLGPDGKPWHSWRMLILPFLESSTTYSQYRFDEPWDGPNNRKLHGVRPWMYFCPSHSDHAMKGQSSYVMVMGKETAFPGPNESTRLEDVADGAAATIAVVESATLGPHWMEPRDLELDRMSPRLNDPQRPGISSPHPVGVNAAFLDCRVRSLKPQGLSPESLRAQFTIRGHETLPHPLD